MTARHPLATQLVQIVGGLVVRWWLRLGFRVRVRGCRPQAPVVLAANHRSFLDPPLVGCVMHEPISYFARASLWRNPLFAFMLTVFYGIPVERENPGISSMKGAIERLRRGITVLVFPEGTRTRDGRLGRLRDGPALFARRAGVPVVPVYIHRSESCWPRAAWFPRLCGPRLEIRFGRPLVPPAGLEARECDRWVTLRLEAWLRRQEAACWRGRGPLSPAAGR